MSDAPAPPADISWLRYVVHSRIEAYEALGWRVVDRLTGTTHEFYSRIMKWDREGDPVEPKED